MSDIKDFLVIRINGVRSREKRIKKSDSTHLDFCGIRTNVGGFVESVWTTWAKGISVQ